MDSRFAIWNILHDGEITVAAHEGADLVLFISIPYLRARFVPLGDSFSLRLIGLRSIEFSEYDEKKKTSALSDIAMNGLELLSTESDAMPVKIATTQGILTVDFEDLEIRLDTGDPVDCETVDKVCAEYWDEWETAAKQK